MGKYWTMLLKIKFIDSNISDAAALPVNANTEIYNFLNYKQASLYSSLSCTYVERGTSNNSVDFKFLSQSSLNSDQNCLQ